MNTPERRPLQVREQRWAKAIASWLGRAGASPNGISLTGMLAALLAGAALFFTTRDEAWSPVLFIAAGVLIQIRLLANMFDGMVALETGKSSPVGELFNEIPDRVSDAAVLIGAGHAAGSQLDLGWAAACLALFIAYIRAEGKVAGAHQDYGGPMAKQQRMMVVTAAAVASAFAPAQWLVMTWALVVVLAGGAVTVVLRLARIGSALRRKS